MLYGVAHFGLEIAWFELLLNLFYIACLVMMGLYFFNRLKPDHFNYLICLTLSVWLLMMLTYFYSRKDWKSYTKRDLWMIFVVDFVIAVLYHYDIYYLEPVDEYTDYLLTEIWIRPTITYGLVACFITEN